MKTKASRPYAIRNSATARAAAAALALALAPALISCGAGGTAAQDAASDGATQVVVSVTTQEAARGTLHDYVNTNGEIECVRSVDCFPDIGGKIARVYVSLGDSVRRGDALAEVDPNEPGTYYRNSTVSAPISGTITATPLAVGTTVSTASAITTVGDISNLQIRTRVPERYVAYLRPGLHAEIFLEAYPGETFAATVSHVSPVLDEQSRTKEILLTFDERDARVNAGMFASVTLYTVDYEDEITIPTTALTENAGVQYAYVLSADGATAVRHEVATGAQVDSDVQVLSGIEEGERIIVQGVSQLSDGAAVRDITDEAGSAAEANAGNAASPE